jgi:hypothetical protein
MAFNNAINFDPFIGTTTWVPDLQFNGVDTGITYATQLGYYAQQGPLVYYFILLALTSRGGFSGSEIATISGLPVQVNTSMSFASGFGGDGSEGEGAFLALAYNDGSSSVLYLQTFLAVSPSPPGAPYSPYALTASQLADNSIIELSGIYLSI